MDTEQSGPPALRLYHELIAAILLQCMPDTPYCPTSTSSPPLVLSHVCRSWRAVVMSETSVWASMAVEMSERNAVSTGMLSKMWLSRSGSRPLRISLSLYGDSVSPQHMEAIHTVFSFSPRWRDIKLFLPMRAFQLSPDIVQHNFPLLELLSLSPEEDFYPVNFPITMFQSAPLLRHVSLGRDFEAEFYTLPFHQITRLDVNIMLGIDDCLSLLAMCPALQHCSINIISIAFSFVEMDTMVHLAELKILSIYTDQNLSDFLDHLTLPALRELEVRHDHETSHISWPHTDLKSLVERSSCSLERLLLREVAMDDSDLTACLILFSTLIELGIDLHSSSKSLTDEALLMLTHNGTPWDRVVLAPKLEVLNLTGDFSFDQNLLLRMIESRWRIPSDARGGGGWKMAQLQELSLGLMDDITPDVLKQLKQFEAEGLKLVLS